MKPTPWSQGVDPKDPKGEESIPFHALLNRRERISLPNRLEPLRGINSLPMKSSEPDSSGPAPAPVSEAEIERLATELLRFFSVASRRIPGYEPEDLVQKAMVRVYQGMDNFRRDSSFRTWAFKIATNVWTNTLRESQAQKRVGDEVSLDTGVDDTSDRRRIDPPAPAPNPEETFLWDEKTRALDRGIATLPTRMARCAMLSLKGGFSVREIATLLKVQPTTVKSQLKEARRRLKDLLREHFGLLEPEGEPP